MTHNVMEFRGESIIIRFYFKKASELCCCPVTTDPFFFLKNIFLLEGIKIRIRILKFFILVFKKNYGPLKLIGTPKMKRSRSSKKLTQNNKSLHEKIMHVL